MVLRCLTDDGFLLKPILFLKVENVSGMLCHYIINLVLFCFGTIYSIDSFLTVPDLQYMEVYNMLDKRLELPNKQSRVSFICSSSAVMHPN